MTNTNSPALDGNSHENDKRYSGKRSQSDLAEQLKRQTGQLAAINAIVTAVSQSLNLDETLQTALEAVLSVIPVEASGISLIDEAAGELVMRAQRGWNFDFVSVPMRIKLGYGMSGEAITTGNVIVTNGDVSDDPRLVVPEIGQEKFKAQVLVPMWARGKVIGVLSVLSHQPYQFLDEEINILRLIADQIGIALDNARLFEAARDQQSRLEAVLQSSADAIIATDNTGSINLINQAAHRVFDLQASQVIGQPLRDAPLPPLVLEKMRQAMAENAETPQMFEVALDNGKYLTGIVSRIQSVNQLQPPQVAEQANGWVVVFQDITHVKEAERTRLQFIQTAAHDLRNPLGVTLSALTMLSRNWKEPTPSDREVFSIALTGINRMQDLIDDLLNLEHIDSGVDLRHEPVNVSELIERCVMDMRPVLQRNEQRLTLDVDLTLPTFYGDERWLYRALCNLIGNAHKYTQTGSTVILRAGMEGDQLLLQVEDNGPGIAAEDLPHLFKRFYRVRDTEKKVPGTGLGLAIVQSVAEKHNGKVSVYSVMGQGTTFSMILPFERVTESIADAS